MYDLSSPAILYILRVSEGIYNWLGVELSWAYNNFLVGSFLQNGADVDSIV